MKKNRLASVLLSYISIIVISLTVLIPVALAAENNGDIPEHLIGGLNLGVDDSKGKEARALFLINPDTKEVWNFPLADIPGGPILGQGMHTAIAPDKKSFYVTMGGNESLPLRLEKFDIDWNKGQPSLRLVAEEELVPANTETVFGWGSDEPNTVQEAHGLNIDPTQKYLMWSNLNSHSVEVLNLADNKLSKPIKDDTVYTPHGLFANPSATLAVTPNYAYGNQTATIWDLKDGEPSFRKTVRMSDSGVEGAWPHMAEWIDDDRFLLPSGHETIDNPADNYEAGLWLCDVSEDNCRNLIGETNLKHPQNGVIKGVSDLVWKKTDDGIRVYVGEGNFLQKDAGGNPVKGYISVWDFDSDSDEPAQFVKRFSPGFNGLPVAYRDTHGMCRQGDRAYTMSFASNYLIELDLDSDTISNVYDRDDGLILPHGVSCSIEG